MASTGPAPAASDAVVRVDDLRVTFPTMDGDVHAVKGLSFFDPNRRRRPEMSHTPLIYARVWQLLLTIDRELAAEARETGCACGGRLHSARYRRKPG